MIWKKLSKFDKLRSPPLEVQPSDFVPLALSSSPRSPAFRKSARFVQRRVTVGRIADPIQILPNGATLGHPHHERDLRRPRPE